MIPQAICTLTKLRQVYAGNNPGITCAPLCLSSIANIFYKSLPSATCPTNQDMGLCGLISATNVQSIGGYSMWSCTTLGVTASSPCSPLWTGLGCSGNYVNSLSLGSLTLSGIC